MMYPVFIKIALVKGYFEFFLTWEQHFLVRYFGQYREKDYLCTANRVNCLLKV